MKLKVKGKKKPAHEEFEKIYAMAPDLEDVAERIGIGASVTAPIPPQSLPKEAGDKFEKAPDAKRLTMKKHVNKDN